ncbi:uncharacterized protein LOC117781511 [Drosophila innubila]|uniref:uncharacterized protein LOC117781511 n=1 Tax=Drosophila innubila TaxID=198719 RepID=UPI00148CF7A2|nr:uncharacterized protein LOC117781511 [Drosophila innubila]
MALKQIKLCSPEGNNLLEKCWLAGERKLSTSHLVKLRDRHEINSVDVIDCCNRIQELVNDNQAARHDHSNNRFVAFKYITRLTFGVSYIHRQQVSTLLDETKHLMNQIKGTNLKFDVVSIKNHGNRKRKRVISTTTMVRLSKRSRTASPQLLDEEHVDYYRNILTESQLWSKDSEVINIKECQTICTSEHFINITQEVTLTEMDPSLMWNDGFGELNQIEQKALEDFLPFRNSLKRKSSDSAPAVECCFKTLRLSTNELSSPSYAIESVSNANPQELDLIQEIESNAMPPAPTTPHPPAVANSSPSPPVLISPSPLVNTVQSKKSKARKRRKCKLKIDKCIKISCETHNKDLQIYYNGLENRIDFKPKKVTRIEDLLNSFKQRHLFPECLKGRAKVTEQQMEVDCEYTIRAMFDNEYSDVLASKILKNIDAVPQQINYLEEHAEPVIPTANSPKSHTSELLPRNNNNTNNNYNNESEHPQSLKHNNFDSYKIMMDLLRIWRKDPHRNSIDANQFVKSFPNRITAALAFSHLLSLSRDGFIQLFTKLDSMEIDTITLGPESLKLIENISELKQI